LIRVQVAQSVFVSRLSIVDLAGSERSKLTQTSGERLKEAGNINRSLMVLGQCLEVLRVNQKRSTSTGSSGLIKSFKPAVVPFRDSKLTEVFQDFFAGSGHAVCHYDHHLRLNLPINQSMIVNVNPYDTGFDENSQVMKFSAIAREVSTVVVKPSHEDRRRTVRLSLADESYDALFDILEGMWNHS
jgi:kinesin family member 20